MVYKNFGRRSCLASCRTIRLASPAAALLCSTSVAGCSLARFLLWPQNAALSALSREDKCGTCKLFVLCALFAAATSASWNCVIRDLCVCCEESRSPPFHISFASCDGQQEIAVLEITTCSLHPSVLFWVDLTPRTQIWPKEKTQLPRSFRCAAQCNTGKHSSFLASPAKAYTIKLLYRTWVTHWIWRILIMGDENNQPPRGVRQTQRRRSFITKKQAYWCSINLVPLPERRLMARMLLLHISKETRGRGTMGMKLNVLVAIPRQCIASTSTSRLIKKKVLFELSKFWI